ncbi:uncharacterized protein LOC116174398 [Photinus pyralis]|uniref:Uncharacterized protein n=1 Tax=Photinus pyralis TaxID=7054 RepID=A0A1Y1LAB3_PHOPY|nr:uncharacterized protein LOC116174398 [Photinus pyralis]
MSAKYFIPLTVLLTFASAANGLNCYVCSGSPTSDCAKGVESSMGLRDCHTPRIPFYVLENDLDEDGGRLQSVCLKFTLTNYDPNLVVRNCGIFRQGVDPCNFLKRKLRLKSCTSCSEDKCNLRNEEEIISVFHTRTR